MISYYSTFYLSIHPRTKLSLQRFDSMSAIRRQRKRVYLTSTLSLYGSLEYPYISSFCLSQDKYAAANMYSVYSYHILNMSFLSLFTLLLCIHAWMAASTREWLKYASIHAWMVQVCRLLVCQKKGSTFSRSSQNWCHYDETFHFISFSRVAEVN